MTNDADTLIACLTPPGRGAIATLAIHGPEAWWSTRALFRRGPLTPNTASLPETPAPGQSWLGWLGESTKGGADEVVVHVKQTIPVVWLEVHCHGGPEVIRLLLDAYQSRGVRPVPWTEFERRHIPAWQVAAQEVLVHAPTVRTAAIALDQWHGAWQRAVEECQACWHRGEHARVRVCLRRLNALGDIGRHLVEPWRVVLAGPPNVGKSSLSNALAGFARSVVSPTPGTTRDVVTTTIALDGWPIELADTAGLRDSGDDLEQAGIALAQQARRSADLCLWLMDGAVPPQAPPTDLDRTLLVVNKVDLPAGWDWQSVPAALHVSAKTGAGLPELCHAIVTRLVPQPPQPGEATPYTDEQRAMLRELESALHQGRNDDVASLLEQWASPHS